MKITLCQCVVGFKIIFHKTFAFTLFESKAFWKWDELWFDHLKEGPKKYGLPLCSFEFKLGICTTIYQ